MLDLTTERSPGNFQSVGVQMGAEVMEVIARLATPLPAGDRTLYKTQKGKTEGENEASVRKGHMIPGWCHWCVFML